MRHQVACCALLLGLISPACVPEAASIHVEPASARLETRDAQVQLVAKVIDTHGKHMAWEKMRWSSSAPDVASVDDNGLVRALRSGRAVITARKGELSAESEILVDLITGLSVRPEALTLTLGGQPQPLTVELVSDAGHRRPASNPTLKVRSKNIAVAQGGGFLAPIAEGRTFVYVSSHGTTVKVPVTVVEDPSAAASP